MAPFSLSLVEMLDFNVLDNKCFEVWHPCHVEYVLIQKKNTSQIGHFQIKLIIFQRQV